MPANKIETFVLRREEQFQSSRYEEYVGGEMISSSDTSILIRITPADKGRINCMIENNNLMDRLFSAFSFDTCITLQDRLLMISNPQVSNVEIPVVRMMSSFIGVTQEKKMYDPSEPVVGSIYVGHTAINKMSFTLSNPERLIEFFI